MNYFRKKFDIAFSKVADNNSGFTLVELVVVIALIVSLTIVVAGSIVSIFRTTSRSAGEKLSAVISQSKVNAISGKKNQVKIYYDKDEESYFASLYLYESNGRYADEPYETQRIYSRSLGYKALKLQVRTAENSVKDIDEIENLTITFRTATGGIESAYIEEYQWKNLTEDEWNALSDEEKADSEKYQLDDHGNLKQEKILAGIDVVVNDMVKIEAVHGMARQIIIYKSTGSIEQVVK